MQQLSLHLAENLAELDARFGASADYYAKEIMIYHCRGCIVLFDGMASLDSLWELLLDAASRQALQQPCPCTGQEVYEHILHGSASPAESTPVEDLPDLVKRLTAGMAVLLLDGCAKGIAFSVQALKYRSVDEPEGEGNLRGSREGFADLLRVNLSLLRRLVRTDDLVLEVAQADTAAGTEYAICYCRGKADPAMVRQVRQTLAAAKPELLLDSSYFVPWLLPSRARLFTPVSYTQRPAAASAKLCEGRIVVLVNGSPSAMVLPALFCENFECLDDYASTAVFASFLRVLNYASFYLTVFLPGAFVCLAVYLPELIPPQLLYKIEAAEKATPLPLFAEMLLVILLLAPNFMPKDFFLTRFLKGIGNTGIVILLVTVMAAIKVEGKALLNFKVMVDSGVTWGIVLLLAFVQPLTIAMAAPGSGITDFLMQLLTPFFGESSSITFALFIGFAAVALTQVMNNGAVGVVLMPVIHSFCQASGMAPELPLIMVVMGVHFAFLTPAASASAALLHGNEWCNTKAIWKSSPLAILGAYAATAIVTLLLGSLLYS